MNAAALQLICLYMMLLPICDSFHSQLQCLLSSSRFPVAFGPSQPILPVTVGSSHCWKRQNQLNKEKISSTPAFHQKNLKYIPRTILFEHADSLIAFDPTSGYGDMTGVKSFDDAWIDAFRCVMDVFPFLVSLQSVSTIVFVSGKRIAYAALSGDEGRWTFLKLY